METIKGYVDHIIYQNKDNGYAVLSMNVDDEEEICVGIFRGVDNGENLEITGEYVEHPSYGFQFKANSFKVVEPDDLLSMERYLGSGAIKGVGEALAKRIVKRFGKDTFRVIEEEPERLVEVRGISERIAQQIADQMIEKKEIREAFLFLQKYGITNTLAVKIYEKYGMLEYGPSIFAHVIFPNEKDLEILKATGSMTVHCPDATVNITAGLMPAAAMWESSPA